MDNKQFPFDLSDCGDQNLTAYIAPADRKRRFPEEHDISNNYFAIKGSRSTALMEHNAEHDTIRLTNCFITDRAEGVAMQAKAREADRLREENAQLRAEIERLRSGE